jgi:hypothetical protein
VHRLVALLLTATFTLPLVPFDDGRESEAQLPACCRRDGKHGCGMQKAAAAAAATQGVWMKAKLAVCGQYPSGKSTTATARATVRGKDDSFVPAAVSEAAATPQLEVLWRISYSRYAQRRGPPAGGEV